MTDGINGKEIDMFCLNNQCGSKTRNPLENKIQKFNYELSFHSAENVQRNEIPTTDLEFPSDFLQRL